MSINENIENFDQNKKIQKEINDGLRLLETFRKKYPFKSDPDSIDNLTPDDLFKVREDYFFRWIEHTLRPLGSLTIGSAAVWRNACNQIDDFKFLLRIAVSDRSLAEKVDAPWERISGMGGDKHIAKKIISCYDDNVLPIFKTEHLEHFQDILVGRLQYPSNYDDMTIGQKYQYLNQTLINLKERTSHIKNWGNSYFMRFLYEMYPPQKRSTFITQRISAPPEPLNKLGLLFRPQSHDEMMFLFSKLHTKIGFPYITKIQAAYPDVETLDNNRTIKKIEIETYTSQFNHDPKDCDIIVCWENDLEEIPKNWPEIIQLKDYL